MSLALVTDSSSLLPAAGARALGVELVEIPVAIDGEPFTGSVDSFYARLRGGGNAATSQPGPGALAAAYERVADDGATAVVSLHLDPMISGTAAAAELAAAEAPVPVVVVGLPTVSFGVAMSVRAAAEARNRGATRDDVVAAACDMASALDNVFAARSAPEGRIRARSDSWALLRFGSVGAEPISTHATDSDAAAVMLRYVLERCDDRVAVGHAAREVEPVADLVAHALLEAPHVRAVERYRVGPAVGAHTGPDAFGAFWTRR
jgi:fatty acid-binding protein DegV